MDVDPNPSVPVNIGNPGEFTINELASMVLEMLPTTSRIVHYPLPQDDPSRRRPDIARARELLAWEPKVPLAEGLRVTADWFIANSGGHPGRSLAPNWRKPAKIDTFGSMKHG
jgi:UDP-glucuronate decarboxylase